ncbi:MAG: molybdenum cofactor guanylyltransferase [Rhodothermales bacterium]|nr:molybdenum cofactor guanylyltransferase [Rhodothermales bacterium]
MTGLILAGGAARRFGADKARHCVEGVPMVVRVARAASAVVAGPLLVSVRDGSARPLPEFPDARYVMDPVAGAGPLGGLHAGLAAAPTPWVLALACDLPFLTPAVLQTLLAARTRDVDAVVGRTPDGRLHPLCAVYHRRLAAVAATRLRSGRRALHGLLAAIRAAPVDLPAGPLRNVNRPADLDNARRNPYS